MLSNENVFEAIDKADKHSELSIILKNELYYYFLDMVTRLENERNSFSSDDIDFDGFLLSMIKTACLAAIQSIKDGHSEQFAVLYAKELENEDGEWATYKAYKALGDIYKKRGEPDIVYREAYGVAIVEGKCERFANKYATSMSSEPFDERSRKYAEEYVQAFIRVEHEGRSPIYADKYATLMCSLDYNHYYCSLYAETYEFAHDLFKDESKAAWYADLFTNKYYDLSCRSDLSDDDKKICQEWAFAFMEGKQIENDLGVTGFTDIFVDQYLNLSIDAILSNGSDIDRTGYLEMATKNTLELINQKKSEKL